MSLAKKMHEAAMAQQESKFWDQYNSILEKIQHEANNGNTHLFVDDVTFDYKSYFFFDVRTWSGVTALLVDRLIKDGFKTEVGHRRGSTALRIEW